MRAYLVSATSLIALLSLHATPGSATTLWSFGDVLVGSTASQTNAITVTNGGLSTQLTVGGAGSPFGPSASQTFNLGTVWSSPVPQAVTYTFSPLSTGAATTNPTASVSGSNGSVSVTLTLTGTGVAPLANVSAPSSLGNVLVGQSATATITVSNTGNGDLASGGSATSANNLNGTIGSSNSIFVGPGSVFNLADSTAGSAAVTSTTASYTYAPTARGAASTVVTTTLQNGVGSGNASGAVATTLTATGVAPIAAIASSTSSNYVLVGSSSTATVTLSNTGNGNLSGLGSISNLNGSVSATATGFTGLAPSATVSLGDTSSTTYTATFAPTVKGATASALVTANLTDGNASGNNAATVLTASLSGTAVAAVQSVSAGALASQVRVGTSTTATTTITNTGNGNLSGLGSVSNLNGSVSSAGLGTGVTTTGGAFSLADSASTTFGYTFTPISRGTVSSTGIIAFSNGNSAGTNASQNVSSVFTVQGVGPVYSSGLSTTSTGANAVADTPTAVANGSIGSASSSISFGSVGFKKSLTLYLALQNTTSDIAAASLTNLTVENYSISGLNASLFSVSLTPGSVITEGGQLVIPITVVNTGQNGLLNSTLTIFTDESAALGGVGDTFTYALTALAVPEPGSLAVLGAGLAALAGIHRRRKAGA